MLEKEIERLERMQRVAAYRAKGQSLFAPAHQADADALEAVLDLIKCNGQSLHPCRMCGAPIIGSASKLYCSDKCRVMAYRKL